MAFAWKPRPMYSYPTWFRGSWDFSNRHGRNVGIRNGKMR